MAVDDTTIAYIRPRPHSPKGELWPQTKTYFRSLVSDPDARFDAEVFLNSSAIKLVRRS